VGFKLAASVIGLRRRGATGPIRTDTARDLKPLPPASWATVALVRTTGFEPALSTTSRRRLLPIKLRARMADGGGMEPPHPCGLGALPTRCIAALPTVLADGARFERAHPCGFAGLACRCLTSRPTILRSSSFVQGRRARTAAATGALVNGICASMFGLGSVGAPRWIRTSNLRSSRARHLYRLGYRGSLGIVMDSALGTRGRPLSVNNASVY
jgi:hypothetical protein